MAKLDPEILAHLEWIGFVRPTGLVVSAPALARAGAILDRRDTEGQRLLRIIRRGTASVVTLRRAQMVLLSAQGMDAAAIAKIAFTSEDRVRDVIRNFNADGFRSLYPKYLGGRPPKFHAGPAAGDQEDRHIPPS